MCLFGVVIFYFPDFSPPYMTLYPTCLFLLYQSPPAAFHSTNTLVSSPNVWPKKRGETEALHGPKCCHSLKQSEKALSHSAHFSVVQPLYLAAASPLLSTPFIATPGVTTQVIQETRINVKPLWMVLALVMWLNCWSVVLNQVENWIPVENISNGIHEMTWWL